MIQTARRLRMFLSFSVIASWSFLTALCSFSPSYSSSAMISFFCLNICSLFFVSSSSLENKVLLITRSPDYFSFLFSASFKYPSEVIVAWIFLSLISLQTNFLTACGVISNFLARPSRDTQTKQSLLARI